MGADYLASIGRRAAREGTGQGIHKGIQKGIRKEIRKEIRLLVLALAETLLLGLLVGCDSQLLPSGEGDKGMSGLSEAEARREGSGSSGPEAKGKGNSPGAEDQVVGELAGLLRIAGSSSMEKLGSILAEGFMERYPNVTVAIQFSGSSAGIAEVLEGSVDIGLSSRELSEEERGGGAVESAVALDGIAVCVYSQNPLEELTLEQLADLYTGGITDWAALGGVSQPVVLVGREAGSGTRQSFEEKLGIRDLCTYANELDGTGAVAARIAATPGAVGYLSFDAVQDNVKPLALEGTEPSAANVLSGSYPLSRPFYFVIQGELSEQNALVQAWFDYAFSAEGQKLAARVGLIPIAGERSWKSYTTER